MTQYIDPNSGAAPQPGGYAGPSGFGKGHAQPEWQEPENAEENAKATQLNEDDDLAEPKTVEEIAAATEAAKGNQDPDEQKQELVEANSNPQKYLAEHGEEDVEAPDAGAEAEASDLKARETEAIKPGDEPEDKEEDADEKPKASKRASAKKKP